MSTNRSRRIDRAAAEQLLRGATVGPEAGQDPSGGQQPVPGRPELAALLAAAAATVAVEDGPPPGEEGAMAGFRLARRQPAPSQHRRRKMADTALARALSAKAMAVALGATAVGGVAVAAGTGRLPEVLGGPAPAPPAAAAPASSSNASDGSATSTAPGRTAKPSSAATRPGGASDRPLDPASADPGQAPDLAVLCRGFAARVSSGAKPKEAAVDPALADLLQAAGAPEKVTGYCAQLTSRGDRNDGHRNDGDQNGDQNDGGKYGEGRARPSAGPSGSPSAPVSGRPGRGTNQQSRGGGNDQD
ncbi:hypothetical protein [Kitasatospora sp. NPDC059673]|uniref:hypothetical protein n=1 Tax=Kitasatospora sp. NPDC059673 TaxID=3346901 RepID=UPI0036A372FF